MTQVSLSQNFDELFIKAERDPPPFCHISLAGNYSSSGPNSRIHSGPTSRVHSNNNSRGSPARKPTAAQSGLCPGNPTLLGLRRNNPTRSHSMRDQTNHMREKYQAERLNQRRLSTKSPAGEEKRRNSSLTGEDIEVTRQFLATNNKVINRGDSFKRKAGYSARKKENVILKQAAAASVPSSSAAAPPDHIYRVAFVGGSQVGKTSIIDQFMSSEHTDVYERDTEIHGDTDIDIRTVSVDVNGDESRLDLIEPAVSDLTVREVVEDCNPDCMVVVYALDDKESFDCAMSSLDWLTKNNYTSTKPVILVGNKSDLARSRVVESSEGLELAMRHSVKFTESSPGCGHHIDELLVGIVMQLRLYESGQPRPYHKSIKDTVKGILSLVTGKEDEKKKLCRNLNV